MLVKNASLGRWVAQLVGRLLATAALWDRIQTSLKIQYKMDAIAKGVAYTFQPEKRMAGISNIISISSIYPFKD
jgi:hypothetical protein